MSLKEDNLRFVLLKAIADAAAKELGAMRADHLDPLLERYDEEGTKSFAVRLPGPGGKDVLVATVSLAVPKDSLEVTDFDAFVAWAETNHPDMVHAEVFPGEPERTVVVPATPDRTVKTIVPKAQTAFLKQLKVTENGIVDPSTGMLVDGIENVPGARPKSFAVKYEHDGPEQLAGAYRAGKLDHIVEGTTLPAVGTPRPMVERRLEIVPGAVVEPPADDAVFPPDRPVNEDGASAPWCGCGGRHEVCPAADVDWQAISGHGRLNGVPGDVAGELAAESGLPGEVAAEMDWPAKPVAAGGEFDPGDW